MSFHLFLLLSMLRGAQKQKFSLSMIQHCILQSGFLHFLAWCSSLSFSPIVLLMNLLIYGCVWWFFVYSVLYDGLTQRLAWMVFFSMTGSWCSSISFLSVVRFRKSVIFTFLKAVRSIYSGNPGYFNFQVMCTVLWSYRYYNMMLSSKRPHGWWLTTLDYTDHLGCKVIANNGLEKDYLDSFLINNTGRSINPKYIKHLSNLPVHHPHPMPIVHSPCQQGRGTDMPNSIFLCPKFSHVTVQFWLHTEFPLPLSFLDKLKKNIIRIAQNQDIRDSLIIKKPKKQHRNQGMNMAAMVMNPKYL